jgi:hypothetical protein
VLGVPLDRGARAVRHPLAHPAMTVGELWFWGGFAVGAAAGVGFLLGRLSVLGHL